MSKKITENNKVVWSDFWLDSDDFDESDHFLDSSKSVLNTGVLDQTTLKLASSRRAIANFVNILTGEDIPVYFWGGDKTGATDGKVVYLSADIVKKEDFDPSVGLALHQGSHIVLTDFDLIKTLWGRISELYKLGNLVGINKEQVKCFTHLMVNYVEDRFIDNYIFTTAPGYRPYYVALYDKYFNNEIIGKQLQGKLMRYPNLASYEARIINLTNPHTDLDALPGLREIAKEISLQEIDRLKTTKDRIKVATEIVKIVFKNIKKYVDEKSQTNQIGDNSKDQTQKNSDKKEIKFDIRLDDSDDVLDKKEKSANEDEVLGGEIHESEKLEDSTKQSMESDKDFDSFPDVTKKDLQTIKKSIDIQKSFIETHGNVDKKSVSAKQKSLLDVVEKSGIVLVKVGMDLIPGNEKAIGIECIVVKKLTKELMFSGMFPMCKTTLLSIPTINDNIEINPPENVKNAVIKGIQLGTLLGKKLQIRQETNTTIFPRRTSGKILRRHLSDVGCDIESIFFKTKVDKYNKLNLHISVDASSSMCDGGKWEKTMVMVVAICKAASMIDNLRVVVSFRTTIEHKSSMSNSWNSYLPYVVCAYDSAKDKFSKIKNLFPYLTAKGATPEGLAFEATMDELVCKKSGETYYFLTISDGEPAFNYSVENNINISYDMTIGADHTRKQYKKILATGVKGMAYFINETSQYKTSTSNAHEKCFRHMYGKDAKFIDVNNVTSIAKTMNELFLEKD